MLIKFRNINGEYTHVTHFYPNGILEVELDEQEQLAVKRIRSYLDSHNGFLPGELLADVISGKFDNELLE
jgi:hypothetical protein